jgi:hypothetical protein
VVPVGLQALNDGAPARSVGPRAAHQDDIKSVIQVWKSLPSIAVSGGHRCPFNVLFYFA